MSTAVRIVLATMLAAICGIVAYAYLQSLRPTSPVWVLTHDLPPGAVLTSADVKVAYVTQDARALFPEVLPAKAGDLPENWKTSVQTAAGQVLRRDTNVVSSSAQEETLRMLTLPSALRLNPGQYIDVYATAKEATPRLLVSGLRVMDVLPAEQGTEVVVYLQPGQVQEVLSAKRTAQIDLVVRLPR